ncbi:hypothetical protein Ciccas_012338, partial [Cichlidogyrus casuarinus]
ACIFQIMLTILFCIFALVAGRLPRVELDANGDLVESTTWRKTLYHGFNSVNKKHPFYFPRMLDEQYVTQLSSWGFNVVRLGVIWEGLVPREGQVNRTYLEVLEKIVKNVEMHRMYVLLEWHQDVLSSRLGTYDSIPNWLLDKFPRPYYWMQYPWPYSQPPHPDNWFENYLTYEAQSVFQNLYSNTSSSWLHFGYFWETLAQRFRNHSSIIGFELVNEPFAGNIFKNPFVALSEGEAFKCRYAHDRQACNRSMSIGGFLVLLTLLTISAAKTTGKIGVSGEGNLVDQLGRTLLLHGFNSVLKMPPWYDAQLLDENRVGMMEQWGFKIARLGIIWNAAMPTESTFNESYFSEITKIVDLLNKKNIYVILDMHQDGLSKKYDTYDAIPNWLINKFPPVNAHLKFPWPLSPFPEDDWFEAYLTYECQTTFQNIYSNVSNAWGHWGNFWSNVASRFKNHSGVLGYELINEPFAGNIYKNPLRGLPGYAGYHNLLPIYDYLVNRIREVDTETLIFYEPVTWGVFTPTTSSWFGTGFDRVPGTLQDKDAYKKSVLSYHYYCWILQTADPSSLFPHWKRVVCDE